MIKITQLIAVSLVCILVGCSETKTVETETAPATPESNTVKVETKTPEKTTEISIGADGAKLETTNGTNGTTIEVKDGSTEIDIKKKK